MQSAVWKAPSVNQKEVSLCDCSPEFGSSDLRLAISGRVCILSIRLSLPKIPDGQFRALLSIGRSSKDVGLEGRYIDSDAIP